MKNRMSISIDNKTILAVLKIKREHPDKYPTKSSVIEAAIKELIKNEH